MIKLIQESLKQIYDNCFVTDYVGDVRNLLINKPKPYRIAYDRNNDIYAIGDAERYTHTDIIRNIVKSGYIYEINKNFDSELSEIRNYYGKSYSDYGDGDIYVRYYLDTGNVLGLMFIPDNYNYFDFEESGFYKAATKISTGYIYTKRRQYFSQSGYFSQLYNSLNRIGEIQSDIKPLEDIYAECKRYGSKSDIEWAFKETAFESGHGATEVFKFLQKLPGNTLDDLYAYWKRKMGDYAPRAFFHGARKYGYTDDEINDYLETVVGVDRIEDSGVKIYD